MNHTRISCRGTQKNSGLNYRDYLVKKFIHFQWVMWGKSIFEKCWNVGWNGKFFNNALEKEMIQISDAAASSPSCFLYWMALTVWWYQLRVLISIPEVNVGRSESDTISILPQRDVAFNLFIFHVLAVRFVNGAKANNREMPSFIKNFHQMILCISGRLMTAVLQKGKLKRQFFIVFAAFELHNFCLC